MSVYAMGEINGKLPLITFLIGYRPNLQIEILKNKFKGLKIKIFECQHMQWGKAMANYL